MKIDRHISDLLYDHDCVIVPSFGGFLVSYQPAQLQSIQHTFYPPSKKIAFNVFLKNNDGLLASHVANREKLAYAEALKNIESFRLEVLSLLDSGKRITIEDVGTLFYDKHKNLQFEPVKHINYLEDAFGLTPVQSPPVKREEQRKKIEKQIRKAVSLRSSEKPARVKSSGRLTTAWKVFNTAALSVALLWFAFNIYTITPHHANISSLNPFSWDSTEKTEAPVVKPQSENTIVAPAEMQKAADSIDNMLPDKQPSTENATAATNAPAPKAEEVIVKPEPVPATTTTAAEGNFFIIAGAFREPGNAEKLVNALKQEGFNGAEIINPEASFKKVTYGSFATRKDAIAALEQIHSAKKEGWIMAK